MLFPQYYTQEQGITYVIYLSEAGNYYQITIAGLFQEDDYESRISL